MSNPNFVSDLVAMAKAFEELPQVRDDLRRTDAALDHANTTIQRLELRIMDLKGELEAAHSATQKAEVERDHAEQMFLETDDRLNAFRRLLSGFQAEATALVAAAEPEATAKPSVSVPTEAHVESPFPYTSVGQSAVDPTTAPTPTSTELTTEASYASTAESTSTEGVSVPSDPTPATPDVQSPAASLSVSAGETSASTPESAGSTQASQHEEAAKPVDPTASSTAGDGPSPVTVEATPSVATSADASSTDSVDDVSYANEPSINANDWTAWDAWAARMNARYGTNNWPPRHQAAQ